MNNQGNGTKLGRPPKEDRGEIILNNGFSKKQWDWFKQEAVLKGMDTMALVRVAAQWWIDSVEAARSGPIATEEEDKKFETLVSKARSKKKKSKTNHKE